MAAHAAAPEFPPGTVSVVTVSENDVDNDGVIDDRYTTTVTVDGFGAVLETVQEADNGADGVLDSVVTLVNSYDDRGRLMLTSETTDLFADGVIDRGRWIEYVYDNSGTLLSTTTQVDVDNDGVVDVELTSVAVVDGRTSTTTVVEEIDLDDDGTLDETATTTTVRDGKGRVLTNTVVVDSALGEAADEVAETVNTYTQRGSLATRTSTRSVGGVVVEESESQLTYDQRGLLTGYVTESGEDVETAAVSYDQRGQRVLLKTEHTAAGVVVGTLVDETIYDVRGRVVGGVATSTDDGWVTVSTDSYERDARGNVVVAVSTQDHDGDGVVDWTNRSEYTYDQRGNRLTEYSWSDGTDAGDEPDTQYWDTRTYDRQGRLLSMQSEVDVDGDGAVDSTSTFTSVFS